MGNIKASELIYEVYNSFYYGNKVYHNKVIIYNANKLHSVAGIFMNIIPTKMTDNILKLYTYKNTYKECESISSYIEHGHTAKYD